MICESCGLEGAEVQEDGTRHRQFPGNGCFAAALAERDAAVKELAHEKERVASLADIKLQCDAARDQELSKIMDAERREQARLIRERDEAMASARVLVWILRGGYEQGANGLIVDRNATDAALATSHDLARVAALEKVVEAAKDFRRHVTTETWAVQWEMTVYAALSALAAVEARKP